MMSIVLAIVVVLAVADSSQITRASDGYNYAVARRGCTQEDAPAMEIYLTRMQFDGRGLPPTPYVRIEVAWSDWVRLIDTQLALIPLSRQGLDPKMQVVRAQLNVEQNRPVWLSGAVVLRRVEPDRHVDGSYDFVGPENRHLRGTFNAPWVASSGSCG